jgi:hypothetical protein
MCPVCGSKKRRIRAVATDAVRVSDGARWSRIRTYWQVHRVQAVLLLLVTLGSPFVGLAFGGWKGIAIGLILSLFSLAIGFFAVTRVKEIERGGA